MRRRSRVMALTVSLLVNGRPSILYMAGQPNSSKTSIELTGLEHLVAGREDSDYRAAGHRDRRPAERGEHADMRRAEQRAIGEYRVALMHVLTAVADVVAGLRCLEHPHGGVELPGLLRCG